MSVLQAASSSAPMAESSPNLAQDLHSWLGSRSDSDALFSYAQRVGEDEAQHYPGAALDSLNAWGLAQYYVPVSQGGKLSNFETLNALLRIASARDLSVSISHAVSFLGSMCIWIAGNAEQQARLAAPVLAGERVSLALTERDHGGDLLSMTTTAECAANGYRVNGEKWLVNGISRNRWITLYTRTKETGGSRGFSLFLLDKDELPAAVRRCLPKCETLGVRGADISGLELRDAYLPEAARIGAEGAGFEIVLKGLQLSRTLCGALSLGAVDAGLDITLDFMRGRRIYGKTVADIPQAQRSLCEAWVDTLIVDCLSRATLRCLHHSPAQASVHSAFVKSLAPMLAEDAYRKLATVMGARYYLRGAHAAGMFQKMLRDNLLIGLFDGSTVVNLYGLSFQMRAVHARATERASSAWHTLCTSLRHDTELPAFDWQGLSITSSGEDVLSHAADGAIAWALQNTATTAVERDRFEVLNQALKALRDRVAALSPSAWQRGEPELFELARQTAIFAAFSSVVAQRCANTALLGDSLAHPAVWSLVVERLMQLATGRSNAPSAETVSLAFQQLCARQEAGQTLGCAIASDSTFSDAKTVDLNMYSSEFARAAAAHANATKQKHVHAAAHSVERVS